MLEQVELRQRKGRTGERYWIIFREGNVLSTQWGLIAEDGSYRAHGSTKDAIPAKGKVGTAAYVNPEENAKFNMSREVRKKREEGYEVFERGAVQQTTVDKIDHDRPLPKNLAFCKPSKKPGKKVMGRTDIIGTVKFNGETVIAHKDVLGGVSIYSRRMVDITGHFPQLIHFMVSEDIPKRTIMLFEGFMGRGATRQDAIKAAAIFRSKQPLAVQKQIAEGLMQFYLFRVPIWDGEHLEKNYPHDSQIDWIENNLSRILLKKEHRYAGKKFLHPIQVVRGLTVDSALEYARANKLEGLVGYLPEEHFGDQAWSFHGKPDRPNHFFKLKVAEEDDFIVLFNPNAGHGAWGTGKNQKSVGALALFQLPAEGGTMVYCGDVGTGLSDEQRAEIAEKFRKTGKTWKGVAEVHFETRFFVSAGDNSNAVQLPRIHRLRTDKAPEECTCEGLTSESSE